MVNTVNDDRNRRHPRCGTAHAKILQNSPAGGEQLRDPARSNTKGWTMNSRFPYLLASACLGAVLAVLLHCLAYHHLWHKCLDETERHTMCMMTLSEPYTIVERGGYDWFVFKDRDAILEQYRRG